METAIFTFELMGTDRLMTRQEGTTTQQSLDDILSEGWEPLHWENLSEGNFVRYRVIMARSNRAQTDGFGFGKGKTR